MAILITLNMGALNYNENTYNINKCNITSVLHHTVIS